MKISRNFFRTKDKNMSVCYMEGKFFWKENFSRYPLICKNFVRCKVRGNHPRGRTVTDRIILSVGK